jgi:hypothetical protein
MPEAICFCNPGNGRDSQRQGIHYHYSDDCEVLEIILPDFKTVELE